MTLYTTKQIADALGISTRRVRKLAEQHGIGTLAGSTRVFTAADLAWFRRRNTTPGRPRKEQRR